MYRAILPVFMAVVYVTSTLQCATMRQSKSFMTILKILLKTRLLQDNVSFIDATSFPLKFKNL